MERQGNYNVIERCARVLHLLLQQQQQPSLIPLSEVGYMDQTFIVEIPISKREKIQC